LLTARRAGAGNNAVERPLVSSTVPNRWRYWPKFKKRATRLGVLPRSLKPWFFCAAAGVAVQSISALDCEIQDFLAAANELNLGVILPKALPLNLDTFSQRSRTFLDGQQQMEHSTRLPHEPLKAVPATRM
jgi:hypothetical protein